MKLITELNVNSKTLKLLEENTELWVKQRHTIFECKAQAIKGETNKLDLKLKYLCFKGFQQKKWKIDYRME